MTNEALQTLLASWFPGHPGQDLQFSEDGSQFLTVTVPPETSHELMRNLKGAPETRFDYLFCLTGVDLGKELGVIYHLESTFHRHMLVVKVQAAERDSPILDSVTDIWPGANFHEREIFDFFGIRFRNHPNLKRLFLTEDWEGFPLRKDYVDEKNMILK